MYRSGFCLMDNGQPHLMTAHIASVCVGLAVGVYVGAGVEVLEGVTVSVGGILVAVCDAVGVRLAVAVKDGGLAVLLIVGLPVAIFVGVGVGLIPHGIPFSGNAIEQ